MSNEIILYNLNCDSAGKSLSGEKNYRLHLPKDIPSCKFWSLIVYDNVTGLMIKTDQPWPSVHSSCKKMQVNQDGSVDIWLGPVAPEEKGHNWIKTIPGKEWNIVLRLYEPLEPWVDESWKPGKVEEVR